MFVSLLAIVLSILSTHTPQTNHTSSRLGHYFKLVRQSRPKACDVCNEIIWHEALVCHSCQVTVHTDKCEAKIEKECEEAVYEVCVCVCVCLFYRLTIKTCTC